MDPFDAPEVDALPVEVGRVSVGLAIAMAFRGLLRNVLPLLAVAVLATGVYVASICTLVGWILVLPLLGYGYYAFTLHMVDGPAPVRALLAWRGQMGRAWAQMVLLGLVIMVYLAVVVGLPSVVLAYDDLQAAFTASEPLDPMYSLKTLPFSLLGSVLICRFLPAPYYVVERGLGAFASFSRSWHDTRGQWGPMIGLSLASFALQLPAQALNVASQVYSAQFPPTPWLAIGQGGEIALALQFVALGLVFFASVIGQLMFASAYRQLTGPAPQPSRT